MVLSTCSPYFRSLFATVPPHLHPVVFLKDVEVRIVELLLRYMYSGQVSVQGERLVPLVQAAKSLRIKGLLDVPVPSSASESSPRPPSAASSETTAHKAIAAANPSHNKPQPVNNRVQTQSHPGPVRKPKMIKPKSSQQQQQHHHHQQQQQRGLVPGHQVSLLGAGGSDARFQRENPLPPQPVAAQEGPSEAARVVYPVISVDDDMR
jgi:hypothetical protein